MLIRRDPVAINSVGVYMQNQTQELLLKQKSLIKNINNILNNYEGQDAKIIVSKFLESASKLNSIISNLDYYSNYMQTLSLHDRDNLNNAKQQFINTKNQFSEELNTANMNGTLNLNSEIFGGDNNV